MTEYSPQNVLLVDRETVHECLKKCHGNLDEAVSVLKGAGVKVKDAKQLKAYIRADEVLSSVWTSDWVFDDETDGKLEIRKPITEEAFDIRRIQLEQDYIAARGLESTGLDGSEIKEMVAFSQFSAQSFAGTMDMLHGIMTVSAYQLKKMADKIQEDILDNDETIMRKHITPEGDILEYEGPKYTPEEKLMHLDRWIDIKDKLRRMAETAHNSAKIRAQVTENATQNEGNRLPRRPRKLPDDPS